ncbi:uncharacterized protein EV420DRAFT_1732692 [Desarmillaria tabescens]|uniref:Uncharacterized protein n=1 Tax=Armillaria tabescens TaxID=1929756 RepID=A0AA39NCT8_ARMTA|nr:uncharacterized protein EV420DRAFT_1732692 [Desarmillaria tabescens]KAK0463133.1 hypothetical protein EV420DRAFT_1732692 [Desarmillaria tabescens]
MEFLLPPAMLPPEQQPYVFPHHVDGDWLDENGNFQTEEINLSPKHMNPCLLTPMCIHHKGVRVRDGSVMKRKLTRRAQRIYDAEDVVAQILEEEECEQNLRHTHLPELRVNRIHNHGAQQPMDPFVNPDFVQCVTSIVEEQLAAHQNSFIGSFSLSSTLSSKIPHPSMDFDMTAMGLTANSTEVFSGDAGLPDSLTLPSFEPTWMTSPFVLLCPPAQTMQTPTSELDENALVSSDGTAHNPIQCLLVFADGETLAIHQGDVPPTKPFCYASNFPNLIRSWDNHSPDWVPSADYPIIIHGHPIPIKYWKDLYKRNKKTGNEWEKLKNDWLYWKAYEMPEAFWAEFSDYQGQRLKYSPIKKILLDRRKDVDFKLAKKVRKEYGDDFINHFGYKKKSLNFRGNGKNQNSRGVHGKCQRSSTLNDRVLENVGLKAMGDVDGIRENAVKEQYRWQDNKYRDGKRRRL